MLRSRLTDPRWVIWLYDSALANAVGDGTIDQDQLYSYATSYDLEELGGLEAVCAWRDPPTLFLLKPMMTSWQPIEDNPTALFQQACSDMRNADASWLQWSKRSDGTRYLDDDATAKIPRDCVVQLGRLVREMASRDGDRLLPFTLPDGWHQLMIMIINRVVRDARTAAAKKRSETSDTATS